MSQWAEIRHLHLVEKVPKKEIARRLKLDVKTVRRAVGRPTPPVRVSPPRVSNLDPWREQIIGWLREEPRLTAKRVRRLLLPLAGGVAARTVRRYVAVLKGAVSSKEAFVHRTMPPGTTMEVDFGESWVDVGGTPCKVRGRRARGDGRPRASFAAPGDGAAYPPAAAGRPAAGVPAGRRRTAGAGADHRGGPDAVGV